jgi:hypothetical protein
MLERKEQMGTKSELAWFKVWWPGQEGQEECQTQGEGWEVKVTFPFRQR